MSHIIEAESSNIMKYGQIIAGDTFLASRTRDGRIVTTLADGLGSGVKANVLSQLTASMAQKFIIEGVESIRAANRIMETLPVCSIRKISYSTFTTLDIDPDGHCRILEYDNPDLLWLREGKFLNPKKTPSAIKTGTSRKTLFYSEIQLEFCDRLIYFSDGVTQAGLGSDKFPTGWGLDNVREFINKSVEKNPEISAKELSRLIVNRSEQIDRRRPHDDITCSVVYYREARETLLITGPPYDREKCSYMVDKFKRFNGRKIISGGTTSIIISVGIEENIKTDMADVHSDIPPRAIMRGADLVTEGMLTINRAVKILQEEDAENIKDTNAAHRLVQLLLESDKIYCLVGTAINEMHQSPDIPMELGIRRISMSRLSQVLKEKYMKEVYTEYI
ncbi:MAG: serine/threonine-protein phosphatase [Spirochaetales bacterium]|nr:serine/threonine-protein phosphatase [Spirochaetales bacterium]